MTITYTVDELVTRVRRAAQLSTENQKLTTAEIVTIADEEIQSVLWPALRAVADEYGVESMDLTVPYFAAASDPLGYSSSVRLPWYASSSTITDVRLVLPTGQVVPLHRVDPTLAMAYGTTTSTVPSTYAIVGDSLRVFPALSANVTVRVFFEGRPNRLIILPPTGTEALKITAVADDLITVETTFAPFSFAGFDTRRLDIVSAGPQLGVLARAVRLVEVDGPGGTARVYKTTNGDLATTSIQGLPVTGGGIVTPFGDSAVAYLCRTGQTCVFPLPDAWWNVAVSQVAARVCLEIGDLTNGDPLRAEAEQRMGRLVGHQANRARKQPQKILGTNGPLQGGRRWWG